MSPFLRVPLHPLFHLAFSATLPSPARPLFSWSPGTSVGLNPRVGAHAHFMGLSADRTPLLKTCPSLSSTDSLLSLRLFHVSHPGWPHVPTAPLKRWWVPVWVLGPLHLLTYTDAWSCYPRASHSVSPSTSPLAPGSWMQPSLTLNPLVCPIPSAPGKRPSFVSKWPRRPPGFSDQGLGNFLPLVILE